MGTTKGHAIPTTYALTLLSSCAIRGSEFSLALFLAGTFPGTLFYVSIYGLARSLAAVLLGPWVGSYVDTQDRLWAMRVAILAQRLAVALSCVLFLVLRYRTLPAGGTHSAPTATCFVLLLLLGCVEKMGAMVNQVALERDWIVVVAGAHGLRREDFNAALRRVDLACKLVAPSVVGVLDAAAPARALGLVMVWMLGSVGAELWAARRLYGSVPEMAHKHESDVVLNLMDVDTWDDDEAGMSGAPAAAVRSRASPSASVLGLAPWKAYFASPVFLASLSGCILWWTVLYFGGQLITYLLSIGFTSLQVTLLRIASVVTELSGTWLAPILMARVGPPRAGLTFLLWQVGCLAIFAGPVLSGDITTTFVANALILGIILKRVGLWGLDLAVQFMVQETTPAASRARFSATELATANLFEIFSSLTTAIFSRPDQFLYPVLFSYAAIVSATLCYVTFIMKSAHLRQYMVVPQHQHAG